MRGEVFGGVLEKGKTRKQIKASLDRAFDKARKAARLVCLSTANWHCERCDVAISDDYPEWHPRRAHVNEKRPRSLGGSAIDITNLEAVCQRCHMPNGQHAPTAERQRIIERRS